jgi:hypothetical protein
MDKKSNRNMKNKYFELGVMTALITATMAILNFPVSEPFFSLCGMYRGID